MSEIVSAEKWIETLGLVPHPEGGFFTETYRSSLHIGNTELPQEFEGGNRTLMTSIYYLLKRDEYSSLHRIKSDELWFFHYGLPLNVEEIDKTGHRRTMCLGFSGEQTLSHMVPGGHWFGAKPVSDDRDSPYDCSLVSCIVAPGFEFQDFELCHVPTLVSEYPEHKQFIERFAPNGENS